MPSTAASTPPDFPPLPSKSYRPARTSRSIPREGYEEHAETIENDKKRKMKPKKEEDFTREQEEKANKLVQHLVSKTQAYKNRRDANTTSPTRVLSSSSVMNSVPKAPTNEWEQLPPAFHAVELEDWEKRIMWDGLDENNKKDTSSEPNAKVDAASLLGQRRNPYLDALVFDESNISWDGSREDTMKKARNVKLILEEGTAGQSVARAVLPPSRPLPFGKSEEYLARYEQERTTPETSTAEVGKALHADREQQSLLIEAKQKKRAQMAIDKSIRVTGAMGTVALGAKGKGRTITSSLMGPGGTERTGRPARAQSHGAHDVEHVEQLALVDNHALVKSGLSKVAIQKYHRPNLPKAIIKTNAPWQFQIRCVPSSADIYAASPYQCVVGSHLPGTMSQAKIRNEADLSPAKGDLVLLEYSEERPPIQLTKGMASKIVNYYRGDQARCPVSAGGGDRPIRRKQTSGSHATIEPDAHSSRSKERPSRLVGPNEAVQLGVVDWIGKPSKKGRDERADEKSIDVLPEGVTEILHKHVHGPFLGEVDENSTQTGLVSNVLVAPMFRHKPESTDFLMILGKTNSAGSRLDEGQQPLGVILRPLPSTVFTVGQTEPRTRVYAPQSTAEKSFVRTFLSFQIAKQLEYAKGEGLSFADIRQEFFPHSIASMTNDRFRQCVRDVAIYDKNSQLYNIKPIGMRSYPGVEALGKRFSPESIAAYKAASAASRRLTDLGLHELFLGNSNVERVGAAMAYLRAPVEATRDLSEKMSKLLEVAKTGKTRKRSSEIVMYEKAAEKLERAWKDAQRKYDVAKFIYEEPQLTPWNLTRDFLDVHKGGQGTGTMKLTGLGDPSGQGEGFSFLREEGKPNKATGNAGGILSAQNKSICGTDNDLRKLTKGQLDSCLQTFGMAQKDIDPLPRWDKVHLIRDLATKAASDGMGDGLERFARGEKMKLGEQKQMYRDRIQVIWCRQRAALSFDAGGTRAGGRSVSDEDSDEDGSSDDVVAKGAAASWAPELPKAGDNEKEESGPDSDDDELAADFEKGMRDELETNQLMTAHVGGKTVGALGDTFQAKHDAREYAAFMCEREEEKAAKEGMLSEGLTAVLGDKAVSPEKELIDRKVVRRRITKTYLDGGQTTVFKFVVVSAEVDQIITRKREAIDVPRDKVRPKKEPKSPSERRVVGHAMFDEDNDDDRRIHTGDTRVGHVRAMKPRTMGGSLRKQQLTKESRGKRSNKRKRQAEEANLYVPQPKRRSNRRGCGSARERRPHVIFADRLESIRNAVQKRRGSAPFRKPVNRKKYPDYYEMISNPIDLQTIRDKNQRYDYKTADAFLRDFDLMRKNCVRFNGQQHDFTLEADAIYEFVKQELTAMEEAVNEGTSTKQCSKSVDATMAKEARRDHGDNCLEIDGVTVDLGDLNDKDFKSNSDSD